jgi:hypothetical protein
MPSLQALVNCFGAMDDSVNKRVCTVIGDKALEHLKNVQEGKLKMQPKQPSSDGSKRADDMLSQTVAAFDPGARIVRFESGEDLLQAGEEDVRHLHARSALPVS